MALENLASKDGETKLGKSDQANLSLTTTLNHRLGFLDVKEEAHGLQRSKNPLEKYDLAELTAQSHEPALIPLAIFRADHGAVRDQRVQHNLGKDNVTEPPAGNATPALTTGSRSLNSPQFSRTTRDHRTQRLQPGSHSVGWLARAYRRLTRRLKSPATVPQPRSHSRSRIHFTHPSSLQLSFVPYLRPSKSSPVLDSCSGVFLQSDDKAKDCLRDVGSSVSSSLSDECLLSSSVTLKAILQESVL